MLTDTKTRKQPDPEKSFWANRKVRLENFIIFFFPYFIRYWKEEPSLSSLFYEQPGIKYLGISNWYKRPSYIKPESFAKTVSDILLENGTGKKDALKIESSLKKNKFKFNEDHIRIDPETLSYLKSLWNDAKSDPETFRKLLAGWFNETMERLTGWYKRKTQVNLLLIGFVVAVLFNVDAISITNKLSKDDKARGEIVQLASAYAQNKANIPAGQKSDSTKDTLSVQIFNLYRQLKAEMSEPNNLLAVGWDYPQSFEKYRKRDSIQARKRDSIQKSPKHTSLMAHQALQTRRGQKQPPSVCEECGYQLYKKKKPVTQDQPLTYGDKVWIVWCIATNPRSLLGFLITTIAISFGAPFWFDLLSKFVKLRGAGKPDEK